MSAIRMEEKIYTAEQVRVILGLKNVRTIHRLVKRGELNAFRIGKQYRVRASALKQFIENRDANRQPARQMDVGETETDIKPAA